MPLCPQITNTPITVSLTADFTVTNVVPVLPANTEQLAAVKVTADNAYTDAVAAAEAAAEASAIAATAVQTSANTIVNASNQLTAINGNGITVYAGSSPTSGARVVLNSSGLAGFNAVGSPTLAISASTGSVEVTGGILSGGSITGTTINVPTVGSPAFSVNALGAVTATNLTLNGGQIFLNGGVFSVSSTGVLNATSGTIGGSTLGATSLTGGLIQTSSGSASVSLVGSNNSLTFKTSNTNVGHILPLSSFGVLTHYGATADPTGGTFPQMFVGSSNVSMFANASNGIGVSTSGTNLTGNFDVSGVAVFASANGTSGEFRVLSTGLLRSLFTYNRQVSTSTRAVLQDSTGNFGNSTSTRRNKHQIESYKIDSNALLQLDVKTFKYNLDLDDDQTTQYGFIAEDAQELGLDELIQYDSTGIPDYFAYDKLPIFLLQLIQELKAEIDQLKGE